MNAAMDYYFVRLSQPNEDSKIRPTEIGIISDDCAEQPSLGGFSRGDTIHASRASNQIPNDKPNSGDDAHESARFKAIGSVARFWKPPVKQPQIILMAHAIRLIRVEAPKSVQVGEPIRLRCLYELRGEKLQSLAWYKNGREFYRYQPAERRQTVLTFSLAGVNVDMSKSRNSTVHLTNTTMESAGRYKCEATSTTFREAYQEVFIRVNEPPSSGLSQTHSTIWIMPYIAAIIIMVANA